MDQSIKDKAVNDALEAATGYYRKLTERLLGNGGARYAEESMKYLPADISEYLYEKIEEISDERLYERFAACAGKTRADEFFCTFLADFLRIRALNYAKGYLNGELKIIIRLEEKGKLTPASTAKELFIPEEEYPQRKQLIKEWLRSSE